MEILLHRNFNNVGVRFIEPGNTGRINPTPTKICMIILNLEFRVFQNEKRGIL